MDYVSMKVYYVYYQGQGFHCQLSQVAGQLILSAFLVRPNAFFFFLNLYFVTV